MELRNDRQRLPRSAKSVLTVERSADGTGWAEEYWLSMSPEHREWVLWITWFDHDADRATISHAGSCARTGVSREAAALDLVSRHWRRRRDLWDAPPPCGKGGDLLSTAQVEELKGGIWPRARRSA